MPEEIIARGVDPKLPSNVLICEAALSDFRAGAALARKYTLPHNAR